MTCTCEKDPSVTCPIHPKLVVRDIGQELEEGKEIAKSIKLKPCPHCGCEPEVEIAIVEVTISCCADMNGQFHDLLDSIGYKFRSAGGYNPLHKKMAALHLASYWNTRIETNDTWSLNA